MKKFLLCLAGASLLMTSAVACRSTASTRTTTAGGLVRGSFEEVQIPAKDFEPVQLVFAETIVNDANSGAFMTYDALLREAAKVNAHAIVNVVIEDVTVCEISNNRNKVCSTTRYGSGLAIRYTKPLTLEYIISHDKRDVLRDDDVRKGSWFGGLFHGSTSNTQSSTVINRD